MPWVWSRSWPRARSAWERPSPTSWLLAWTGRTIFMALLLIPGHPTACPAAPPAAPPPPGAAGFVALPLGTDTGGSGRVPASNCGLFGIRPTHDRVSLAGVNPLALSFDTLGVLAGSAEVLARAAAVLLAVEVPETAPVGTVHVLQEPLALVDAEIREALTKPLGRLRQRFEGSLQETSINAVVGEAPDAGLQPWYETFITIQWAEIWSSLGTWVEAARPDLGPRTRQNFDMTRTQDRRQVGAVVRRRERYFCALKEFLGPRDLLVLPTVPAPAPLKGTLDLNRTQGNYYPRALSLTAIAGVARLPQVTM